MYSIRVVKENQIYKSAVNNPSSLDHNCTRIRDEQYIQHTRTQYTMKICRRGYLRMIFKTPVITVIGCDRRSRAAYLLYRYLIDIRNKMRGTTVLTRRCRRVIISIDGYVNGVQEENLLSSFPVRARPVYGWKRTRKQPLHCQSRV